MCGCAGICLGVDIKNLPLSATSSTLSALSAHLLGLSYPNAGAKLDAAGYESDGGEAPKEVEAAGSGEVQGVDHAHDDEGDATKSGGKGREEEGVNWGWRFSKSPLGAYRLSSPPRAYTFL